MRLGFRARFAEGASEPQSEAHNPQHGLGQGRFHRGGGLVSHAGQDVRIAVQRHGYRGVAQEILY